MQIFIFLLQFIALPVVQCSHSDSDENGLLPLNYYGGISDFLSPRAILGLTEDKSITNPLDTENSSKDDYRDANTKMEESEINCNGDGQATLSNITPGDIAECGDIQVERQYHTKSIHLSKRQLSGKVDNSTNTEEQIDDKVTAQELLGKKDARNTIEKRIRSVGGCFTMTLGPGVRSKNMQKIYHGDLTTIFSPFFIVTIPTSIASDTTTSFKTALYNFLKPMLSAYTSGNLLYNSAKGSGVYAHIDEQKRFNLRHLPIKETLLIVRDIEISDLRGSHPWDLQDGDRVIWIATADIDNREETIKALKIVAHGGIQSLYGRLCELFPTIEKAIVVFKNVGEERLFKVPIIRNDSPKAVVKKTRKRKDRIYVNSLDMSGSKSRDKPPGLKTINSGSLQSCQTHSVISYLKEGRASLITLPLTYSQKSTTARKKKSPSNKNRSNEENKKPRKKMEGLLIWEQCELSQKLQQIIGDSKGYFIGVYMAGQKYVYKSIISHGNLATMVTSFSIVTTLATKILPRNSFAKRAVVTFQGP